MDINPFFKGLINHPDLPSPSVTALEVIKLIRDDRATLPQIARIIEKDPSLSGKVLRYANSAAHGSYRATSVISEAITRIGLMSSQHIALGLSIVSSGKNLPSGFPAGTFWLTSLTLGYTSKAMSKFGSGLHGNEAFTAGLLLPIGKLAMACALKSTYLTVSPDILADASLCEENEWGARWNVISAALMAKWGVSNELVSIAARFHEPLDSDVLDERQRNHLIFRSARIISIKIIQGEPIADGDWMNLIEDALDRQAVIDQVNESINGLRETFKIDDQPASTANQPANDAKTIYFGMNEVSPDGTGARFDDPDKFLRAIVAGRPQAIYIEAKQNSAWIASTCAILKKMEATKQIAITLVDADDFIKRKLVGCDVLFRDSGTLGDTQQS